MNRNKELMSFLVTSGAAGDHAPLPAGGDIPVSPNLVQLMDRVYASIEELFDVDLLKDDKDTTVLKNTVICNLLKMMSNGTYAPLREYAVEEPLPAVDLDDVLKKGEFKFEKIDGRVRLDQGMVKCSEDIKRCNEDSFTIDFHYPGDGEDLCQHIHLGVISIDPEQDFWILAVFCFQKLAFAEGQCNMSCAVQIPNESNALKPVSFSRYLKYGDVEIILLKEIRRFANFGDVDQSVKAELLRPCMSFDRLVALKLFQKMGFTNDYENFLESHTKPLFSAHQMAMDHGASPFVTQFDFEDHSGFLQKISELAEVVHQQTMVDFNIEGDF